ncbi:MAG: hypothetical protein MRJ93_00055 [Nitrososphaeraceae archaeon]|nr:hypothetical protein [Nitrososphaeraceae archaeon]
MPTTSRTHKIKTKKHSSGKKRTTNLTQKKDIVQSLNQDRQISTKYKYHSKDTSIHDDPISIGSTSPNSSPNQRIPPRYFDGTEHYSKQSIKNLQTIYLNFLEYQKNLINIYRESYFKMLDEYSSFWKDTFVFEKYLNVYKNMNKQISENVNNTSHLINDIIVSNIHSSGKSLNGLLKYYYNLK